MNQEEGKKLFLGNLSAQLSEAIILGKFIKKHLTYQNPIFISSDCILCKVDQVRGNISKRKIVLNVSHKLNIIPVRKTKRAPFIQLSHHSIST